MNFYSVFSAIAILGSTCPICQKVLSTPSNVKIHIDNVHTDIPMDKYEKCPECERSFKTRHLMLSHLSRKHGVYQRKRLSDYNSNTTILPHIASVTSIHIASRPPALTPAASRPTVPAPAMPSTVTPASRPAPAPQTANPIVDVFQQKMNAVFSKAGAPANSILP